MKPALRLAVVPRVLAGIGTDRHEQAAAAANLGMASDRVGTVYGFLPALLPSGFLFGIDAMPAP